MKTDRLDLTGLLEKLAAAGLPFSDLLLPGQTFPLRVTGWSMAPALFTGDRITVDPASPRQLRVGDLLLFHHSGRLICHRLVAIRETGTGPRLITKGDASTGCDPPLRPEHVLGRVVKVRPNRLARLRNRVAQGLLVLQGLRSYRRIMRTLLSRWVAYSVGIPEERRGFRYHRIGGRRSARAPVGHHRFHLVATLAGIRLGSAHVEAGAEGFWVRALRVRTPYRGLGVASRLLDLAATAAGGSRQPAFLAAVEPGNTAALRLFTKAGFRKTGDVRGGRVSLRRDL